MATHRLEFRILGPLLVQVDGENVPVGGPKQRALLALLLLSANRVVSRDRLIAELFAEQGVGSADHALRNHVSRLRKVLSVAAEETPRLAARAPGYLLRVEPGELDFERFERLLAEGHDALGRGDPAAAAAALRAADDLWRGRALADLEFEPFGRVDVERLEELRLAAAEERIDAELALGRQRELVAELEALCAEHPYRERFRAQLMLALYRSGRQAEGLGVYRHTRTLLRDELGLEPGVELQQLEHAILVQDPELTLAPRERQPVRRDGPPVCPFKGLAPFETADAELFFGRERVVDELVARLPSATFLAVIGASGSGKSSLLRAGLLPALEPAHHVVVRPGEHPAAELERALEAPSDARVVIAIDQFEEVFAPAVSERERREFVDALVEAAWDPDRRAVVISALRADYFGEVARYGALADLVSANQVLLGPMTSTELRRAVTHPAESVGLVVEPALVDALVDDTLHETGTLSLLSAVLVDLWRDRDGKTLTLAAYERLGGSSGAVGRHAESAVSTLDDDERATAKRLLLRLVAGGDREPLRRRRATRGELDADDPMVARVLDALIEARLLVADEGSIELVHDALLDQWPTLAAWLEDDAAGRRLRRHLAQTAAGWEVAGRDEGELYRGTRLAAAVEWADAVGEDAGLNRLEREFVDESRAAFARQGERQRRSNRRLRASLAAVIALLVAALLAGAAVLVERGTARSQATAAIAQRLGAQALVEPDLDRSLLLAREGMRLQNSAATRGNLLAALLRSPAALAVLRPGGSRILDDALSPDGRLFAARGDDGHVTLYDTRTLRVVSRFATNGQLKYFGAIVRPDRAVAFSPDGRELAVGDSDGRHATVTVFDVVTHRRRGNAEAPLRAAVADVAFAPDGRSFVSGEIVSGRRSPPQEVLVLRRTSDARALRASRAIAGGRLIGYALQGRVVLVTSGETRSFLLDAHTFAPLGRFGRAGAAAVAPDGRHAAFGQDDGSVVLVDLRSGRERAMTRRAPGRVLALAFAADGKSLATTSDDGSVTIWDVAGGTLRETYGGHAAAASGPLFGPDGRTLYTGSRDGSAIVWDVAGARRLGKPFRFAPPTVAEVPKAVAVSPDGSRFVTSPGPGRVTVRRTSDASVVMELRGLTRPVESLAFSRDGALIAADGDGASAVVWNAASGRIVRLLGDAGPLGSSSVAISPDGRLLATAGVNGRARVYRLRTGKLVGTFGVPGSLQDLDFSPDGRRLAAAGLTGEMAVWDVGRRTVERRLQLGHAILVVRFSPDGRTIATGDLDGSVAFTAVDSGRPVGTTLSGQNGAVFSVAFSPDGRELLTTSSDGKLRLWDLAWGKLVGAPFSGPDAGGYAAYLPDGKRVIAVFSSGAGVLWNVDPAAWARQACRIAHRNLTRSEWRDFLPRQPFRKVCG